MDTVLAAWASWLGVNDASLLVAVALLLLARLLPLSVLAPWVSPMGTPAWVSLTASAMLGVVLLPQALQHVPAALPSGVAFGLLLVREALVGAAFSFLARLPLEAMTMAGHLATRVHFASSSSLGAHGPLSALYRWLGLVLFVACGGAELSLRVVADGLAALPLGKALVWSDVRGTTMALVGLCGSAVTLSLLLSMPVLLGGLLIDVAQGLAQRWLPPWTPSLLWVPTRQLAAIAMVMASLSFVASALPGVYEASITQAQALLHRLTP